MKTVPGKVALHCVLSITSARIQELERVIDHEMSNPYWTPGRLAGLAKLRLHASLLAGRAKDSSHPGRAELGDVPMDQLGAICAIASGVTGLWSELRAQAVPVVLDIMDVFAEKP